MKASAREITRPPSLHFSQNSRSRPVSSAPSRPRRTIQSVIRSMSAFFMGLRAPSTHAIPEMTSGAVSRRHSLECRHLAHAAVGLDRAARIEVAAWRRVEGARDLAPGFGGGRGGDEMEGVGNGCDQGARVGMTRILEDLLPAALLDDAAEIHHGDPVAHMLDHAEIVADHDVAEAHFLLEIEQQV